LVNVKYLSVLPLRPNWLSVSDWYCAAFGGHPHQSKIGSEEPIFDSFSLEGEAFGEKPYRCPIGLIGTAEGGSSIAYRLRSEWANSGFLKSLTSVPPLQTTFSALKMPGTGAIL